MTGRDGARRGFLRARTWLIWWALLMSVWIIVDDSVRVDELLVGAAAAALAALLAEVAGSQAATRLSVRARWLGPALRLPADVLRDTCIVFAALWRRLVTGEVPRSAFRELPTRFGSQTQEDKTRRALIIGARSLAPNTFALGIDAERDVMVVHQLVPEDRDVSQ